MDPREQLELLCDIGEHPRFEARVRETLQSPLFADGIDILQINAGRRCNLRCKHCHVGAGPERTETMQRRVMARCLEVLADTDIPVIDITGGAPEMNPDMEWFLLQAATLGRRLMVRSNIAILMLKEYAKFIDIYTENGVEIIASLPDYRVAGTDRQRGEGVFDAIIGGIKILNDRGYGSPGSGLVLNLVFNPAGAYLPGPQAALEDDFRARLDKDNGVAFNNLFTITNLPVGRYLEYLVRSGNYGDYFRDLCGAYNPAAVERVMCKTTLSVGWDGTLYDCDFNQMLELPVNSRAPRSIFEFDMEMLKHREIIVGNHCYGCVAGSGSSCQGATAVAPL